MIWAEKSIDICAVILREGYGFSFSVRTFKEAIVKANLRILRRGICSFTKLFLLRLIHLKIDFHMTIYCMKKDIQILREILFQFRKGTEVCFNFEAKNRLSFFRRYAHSF